MSIKILVSGYLRNNLDEEHKKQIKIIIGSIIFLVFWFVGFTLLLDFLKSIHYKNVDELDQFNPMGIVFFIAMLTHVIVKYQFLRIRVIAAGALTVIAWLIILSQFFISNQSPTNITLTAITLALVTILGFRLFKAIKEDIKISKELHLASQKLSKINEKLEEVDRAKSEFISIASHQLRTPLTSIKGYTSLILENTFGKIPFLQRQALEKVFVNNEKLVLLVEDMLNVSRLEAGRLEYEFEEESVLSVVKEVVSNMRLYAKNKKLYLKMIKPKDLDDPLAAIIDKRKISEIISNLIDNSIKYTSKGGIIIKVEKLFMEEKIGRSQISGVNNRPWVRISITDTGIGMNEKEIGTIFDKYKKGAKNGEKTTGTGTGLGVYISLQMIKAHGGNLYATSPGRGKGSTFVLELPLVKNKAE